MKDFSCGAEQFFIIFFDLSIFYLFILIKQIATLHVGTIYFRNQVVTPSVIFTHRSFCCCLVDRECWMENMMTFQNIHFTWLEGLRRSLPRLRRLPRSLQPSCIPISTPSLLFTFS